MRVVGADQTRSCITSRSSGAIFAQAEGGAAAMISPGPGLAGGGSLLIGLPDRIRAETGMPTRVVADPLGVVVEGAGIILENFSRYGEMIFGDDGN